MSDAVDFLTIENIANWSASGAIIFGGIIPYVPQYREIKKKEDAEGFSLYVCLTLLIANTLRILFWFGKHYEIPLLLQSICMIITMFMMIKLCVKIRNQNQIIKAKEHVFTGKSVFPVKEHETELHCNVQLRRHANVKPAEVENLDRTFFWKWTNFRSYLGFMVLFATIGGIFTYILVDIPIFVETIGLLAVLTEAMLGVPQFFRNFSNKSTSGMSIAMVGLWTMGDAFKTCYFILRDAPIQFKICGVIQVLIDLAILAQVYIYQSSAGVHSRIPSRAD